MTALLTQRAPVLCQLSSGAGFTVAAHLPGEIAELLGCCLPGWRITGLASGSTGGPAAGMQEAPEIVAAEENGGYLVRHALLPGGVFRARSPVEAANAVAGAATGSWIRVRADWVQLHAAAVLLGGRLTLLLGASGAGKSTLALELAAAGHRLFGDDRLAVALPPKGAGMRVAGLALGVGPKLRLPLPTGTSVELRRLAAAWRAAGDGAVAFLRLPADLLAAPGDHAEIERLVLLERGTGAAAALQPAEAAAMLRAVLPNALAPRLGPAELLAWARDLVERLPCLRLRYQGAGPARALLEALP